MKQYYALSQEGGDTNITIYGDITTFPWMEGDVSAYLLSKKIEDVQADTINVYINSYGGEVSEGLAIYNALKRHGAQVHTHCDGFACSAAAVVFAAGHERIMGQASLLMVHNAWTSASGNAAALRKTADDLDIISAAAANAFRAVVTIDDDALNRLLDNESWIAPQDALAMGFATKIETYPQSQLPAASARAAVMAALHSAPACAVQPQADAKQIAKELIAALRAEAPKHNPSNTFLNALMRGEDKQV